MEFTWEQLKEAEFLSSSPGGELLRKLGEKLSFERVCEVEVILLQQELDGLDRRGQGEVLPRTVPAFIWSYTDMADPERTFEASQKIEELGFKVLATHEGVLYLRKRFLAPQL